MLIFGLRFILSKEQTLRSIRFVFRCLSVIALAIAVIMAIGDSARSVAASQPVLSSLKDWIVQATGQTTLFAYPASSQTEGAFVSAWNVIAPIIGDLPGAIIFLVCALIFYVLGRRPKPRYGRIAQTA